jgi:hypothetical protein
LPGASSATLTGAARSQHAVVTPERETRRRNDGGEAGHQLHGLHHAMRAASNGLATIQTHAGVRKQLLLRASARVEPLETAAAVAHAARNVDGVVERRRLVGIVRRVAKQAARRSILLMRTPTTAARRWISSLVGGAVKWKRGCALFRSRAKTPSTQTSCT